MLLVAILAVRLSVGAGLPSLLVYLLMGVLLGEAGLGIQFEDASVAHALGFAALVLILAEGGLTTQWAEIRPAMRLGISLATVGVAVSVTVVAVGAHYLFGLDWELAVLLGAVTSPTDAAAVFSVLRRVPLPHHLTGALEAESGLNDAPTVLLVTLVSTGAALDHGVLGFAGIVAYELLGGLALGLLVGFGGAWVMRRVALPSSGLYPLAVLVPDDPGVRRHRGAARVRVRRGLRRRPGARQQRAAAPRRDPVVRRGGRLAGADRAVRDARAAGLAGPDHVARGGDRGAGRPAADLRGPAAVGAGVLRRRTGCRGGSRCSCPGPGCAAPCRSCSPRSRWPRRSPGPSELFDIVFVMVVIYTLLTGPTLPWVARRLRVTHRGEPRDLDVEAAPLERIAADLLQISITAASLMHGVEVGELRLPGGGVGLAGRPRRADDGPRAAHRAAARRRPARGDPPQAAGGDRGPAAGGVEPGPAGALARRAGAARSRTAGQPDADAGRRLRRQAGGGGLLHDQHPLRLDSLPNRCRRPRPRPGPRSVSTTGPSWPRPNCWATSRAAASLPGGPHLHPLDPAAGRGVAGLALAEAAGAQRAQRLVGQPGTGARR